MRQYSFTVHAQRHVYGMTVAARNRYQAAANLNLPLDAIPDQRIPELKAEPHKCKTAKKTSTNS
jgi:hypothetical protein